MFRSQNPPFSHPPHAASLGSLTSFTSSTSFASFTSATFQFRVPCDALHQLLSRIGRFSPSHLQDSPDSQKIAFPRFYARRENSWTRPFERSGAGAGTAFCSPHPFFLWKGSQRKCIVLRVTAEISASQKRAAFSSPSWTDSVSVLIDARNAVAVSFAGSRIANPSRLLSAAPRDSLPPAKSISLSAYDVVGFLADKTSGCDGKPGDGQDAF